MKAIVFQEGSQWEVQDVPTPAPGVGEVLLEVIRTGVCGTDEHLLHGGFIAKLPSFQVMKSSAGSWSMAKE